MIAALSLALAALVSAAAPLSVSAPWARATPPGAENGAGYLAITNPGTEPDRLVAVETPAARRAELHSMSMAGGKMTMRALPDGIEIPAGGTVTLAPGGLHLMFLGITAPLVAGTQVPVTLRFAKAQPITVQLDVKPLGAKK